MGAESTIKELALQLPPPAEPVAVYKPALLCGNLLYVSGHGPRRLDTREYVAGRVGADLTLEQGYDAARLVGLSILSTVRAALGSLDRVGRLVKTLGMVCSTPEFKDHPKVIDGFSDLMAKVFGPDAGIGARSAVGMPALPGGIPVEIECVFEVKPPAASNRKPAQKRK
jgi:enamine deaminase RidA (YjgF/YER057c/UK114 family)